MTRIRFALLLACLPAVLCLAADKTSPVKRGVSDDARTKLLKQSAKTEAADAAEAQALARRVADSLNGSLSRQQKLARAAADKAPDFAVYQRELKALQGNLAASSKAAKTGRQLDAFSDAAVDALAKLHESHRSLFADLIRAAKLDDKTAVSAIAQAFGLYGKVSAKGQGDGTFKIQFNEPEDASDPPPPPQSDFTFEPSFAEQATSSHTEGFAYSPVTSVDRDSGRTNASAGAGGAGYQVCRAAVAEFVTVPAGFGRLRVTMRGNVDWRYGAFAVGGASSANGGLRMRVEGFDGFSSTRKHSLGAVLAPVAWWVIDEGDEPFVFSKTFNLPNADGGEFLVTAGGYGEAWAAVVGGAVGKSTVIVERVQIEALN